MLSSLVSVFALVGLVALGHWIFKKKWSVMGKSVGMLFVLALGAAVLDSRTPMVGLFNPVSAVLATGGIVIVANWLYNRRAWSRDWRPKAVTVAVALALLATIWIPVLTGPVGSLPRVPVGGFTSPSVSGSSPSSGTSALPIHRSPRPRADFTPCEEIPYHLRTAVERCAR